MKTKLLVLLGVGTLGVAAGVGLCLVMPSSFRGRLLSSQSPTANMDRQSGASRVCSGLLNASEESFERGNAPEGKALLFAAMAHPLATPPDFEKSVEFAISQVAAPQTSLQIKFELLQGTGARVTERAGTVKDLQELPGLFRMRDKLVAMHQDIMGKASSALLTQIQKISADPPADLLHKLVTSGEWHDFTVAKRFAPGGWQQSEEIGETVTELIKQAASSVPSKKELEGLMPRDASDLSNEGDVQGAIEARKAELARRLKEVSGEDVIAIPRVLGDQLLSEQYEALAAALVAAIRACEAVQLKAYNLWALNRIHASETAPGWETALAPIDTSYLQSVVATLYGDVTSRRLKSEMQPAQLAAKVRVMIRQAKTKPTSF